MPLHLVLLLNIFQKVINHNNEDVSYLLSEKNRNCGHFFIIIFPFRMRSMISLFI